jgi:hypothetical protein
MLDIGRQISELGTLSADDTDLDKLIKIFRALRGLFNSINLHHREKQILIKICFRMGFFLKS